jgi:hypothetical protein
MTPIPTDTATMPTGRCHSGRVFRCNAREEVTLPEVAWDAPLRAGLFFRFDIRHIVVFDRSSGNHPIVAATEAMTR